MSTTLRVSGQHIRDAPLLDANDQLAVIRGLREGSRDAWARLYDNYSVDIWRYVARLLGPDAASFSLSNVCHGWVQPTLGCGTKVTFKPASAGDKTATFQVTAADNVVQSARLTGTGQ